MAQTVAADLIQPEVMADMIEAELPNKLRFAPLAVVDTTLEGNPGDTITRPEWDLLSDATVLAETDVIVPEKLTMSSDGVTIKEAGKGVEVTDKALLTSIGQPLTQARLQIVSSITRKIDADCYTTLNTGASAVATTGSAFGVSSLTAAFGQYPEMDEPSDMFAALVVSNADYLDLLASELLLTRDKAGDQATILRGSVGSFMGVPVITSNRASAGALLVPNGALVLAWKRRPLVETDRDILARSTVITGNVHYGTFLTKNAKVVRITTTRA